VFDIDAFAASAAKDGAFNRSTHAGPFDGGGREVA
jgi:hypothetical protein